MTARGWTTSDVVSALESRSYQRLAEPVRRAAGGLWYGSPTSTAETKQYIQLQSKFGGTAYGVRVGFSLASAKSLLEAARARINEIAEVSIGPNEYCWTLFDAGRALNWPLLTIPHPNDKSMGAQQFDDLAQKFLGPVCESVIDAQAVLERLLRTEVPFDWGACNPIVRGAEVIATAVAHRIDLDPIVERLRGYQNRLNVIYRSGDKWKFKLDALVACLTVAADKAASGT
jgi:hypothetical protein